MTATKAFPCLVERNGQVWANDLPLAAGTNAVTLTATDAAGNVSTQSVNVSPSGVRVAMDAVTPADELHQSAVDVTGSISAGYQVSVNGTWSAANVPMSSGGTALLNLVVTAGVQLVAQVKWWCWTMRAKGWHCLDLGGRRPLKKSSPARCSR
jgi:hypothetical protein